MANGNKIEREQWLPTCKNATLLIEKKEAYRLTMVENIRLQLHLSICKVCRLYQMQTKLIDTGIKHWLKAKSMEEFKVSEEFKSKIINEIEKES